MSDLEEYLTTGKREVLIPAWEEYKALCRKLHEMEKETELLNNELASEKEHHRLTLNDLFKAKQHTTGKVSATVIRPEDDDFYVKVFGSEAEAWAYNEALEVIAGCNDYVSKVEKVEDGEISICEPVASVVRHGANVEPSSHPNSKHMPQCLDCNGIMDYHEEPELFDNPVWFCGPCNKVIEDIPPRDDGNEIQV